MVCEHIMTLSSFRIIVLRPEVPPRLICDKSSDSSSEPRSPCTTCRLPKVYVCLQCGRPPISCHLAWHMGVLAFIYSPHVMLWLGPRVIIVD